MGIGTVLAELTIQRAHANGLRFLAATTQWENRAAQGMLRRHGFRARQCSGEIQRELALEELGSATANADARPGTVFHAHHATKWTVPDSAKHPSTFADGHDQRPGHASP